MVNLLLNVPAHINLRKIGKIVFLVIPLCLQASVASPEESNKNSSTIQNCQPEDEIGFRGFTARLENDTFTNTDQNYTNGLAVTAVSHDIGDSLKTECLPLPLRLHSKFIKALTPGFWTHPDGTTSTYNVVVKLGQAIFTPKDFSSRDLILNDRPYAGLLYVGMSWNQRSKNPEMNLEILDTREITLGIIGPWSLAKEAQDAVHDATTVPKFYGWSHQLNNEPAIQLAMDKKFKSYQGDYAFAPGFSGDYISSLGVRLGNIETSVTLGIEGRLGLNLPNDFGSYTIRPGAENRPPSTASPAGRSNGAFGPQSGVHLFSILETKLVARDFSLDGNLFSSSHHVTRRPWVAFAAIGVSLHTIMLKRGYKLALMQAYHTFEFEEQEANHAYGSVALSMEF